MSRRPRVRRIEILRDRAATARPDDGFLHLRRLDLVNVHADGGRSPTYPCDMVSRRHADAVAVVVWGRDDRGRVVVALRESLRPPIWFRRDKRFVQPDRRRFGLLLEIVAGLLEETDRGPAGLARRGALEVLEEVGWRVKPSQVRALGGALFASPGITDEKVFFRHVEVDLARGGVPAGDGSVMEQAGRVVLLPLETALRRCASGMIPDMKTALALGRLRDHLSSPLRRRRRR